VTSVAISLFTGWNRYQGNQKRCGWWWWCSYQFHHPHQIRRIRNQRRWWCHTACLIKNTRGPFSLKKHLQLLLNPYDCPCAKPAVARQQHGWANNPIAPLCVSRIQWKMENTFMAVQPQQQQQPDIFHAVADRFGYFLLHNCIWWVVLLLALLLYGIHPVMHDLEATVRCATTMAWVQSPNLFFGSI